MTKIIIATDGTVRGLWTDEIGWTSLGKVAVERASHIEFCERRQHWYVRVAQPRGWFRRFIQRLVGRPCGEILHGPIRLAESHPGKARHARSVTSYDTAHGRTFQISLAYSAMVRSLENFPDPATFRMAFAAQASRSG